MLETNLLSSDVESWIRQPMTQFYFKHVNQIKDDLINSLIDGGTLIVSENAVVKTAQVIGQISSLKLLQSVIIDDMKRELKNEQ